MSESVAINEITRLKDEGNFLNAADIFRQAISETPGNYELLTCFAVLEQEADSYYLLKIKAFIDGKSFDEALRIIKEWLSVVGERKDILDCLNDILLRRRIFSLEQNRAKESELKSLRNQIFTSLNEKQFRRVYKLIKEYSLAAELDDDLNKALSEAVLNITATRTKTLKALILSDCALFFIAFAAIALSFFALSSETGFVAGLVILLISLISSFATIVYYVLPHPTDKSGK